MDTEPILTTAAVQVAAALDGPVIGRLQDALDDGRVMTEADPVRHVANEVERAVTGLRCHLEVRLGAYGSGRQSMRPDILVTDQGGLAIAAAIECKLYQWDDAHLPRLKTTPDRTRQSVMRAAMGDLASLHSARLAHWNRPGPLVATVYASVAQVADLPPDLREVMTAPPRRFHTLRGGVYKHYHLLSVAAEACRSGVVRQAHRPWNES